MISPNLDATIQHLARPAQQDIWLVSMSPNLDAESGCVVVQGLAPRALQGDSDVEPDKERWKYVVRWAERWRVISPRDAGQQIRERFAELEVTPKKNPLAREIPKPVGRGTLLLDATKCGKLLADAIFIGAGRRGIVVLESALGVAQLEGKQEASIVRMPALESRGAIRAVSDRLILADAPWADDLRGQISTPAEVEAGAERALGVALWWLMRCTGDGTRKPDVPLDPDFGGVEREDPAALDLRWNLTGSSRS